MVVHIQSCISVTLLACNKVLISKKMQMLLFLLITETKKLNCIYMEWTHNIQYNFIHQDHSIHFMRGWSFVLKAKFLIFYIKTPVTEN